LAQLFGDAETGMPVDSELDTQAEVNNDAFVFDSSSAPVASTFTATFKSILKFSDTCRTYTVKNAKLEL